MTLRSLDGVPIVLVTPASPLETVMVVPAATAWSFALLDEVEGAVVVGVEVVAERLVEDVHMVDRDGVVDGLQERGVEARVLGAEDAEPDELRARRDSLDPDPARPVER